ncbi:ABC transporter ATP-binding protein [Meiothermus sp.]|jgi:putative ABC transport system ATP-binding protein|uniref:ABC transporter ATP-binding protein n=1 Tax=Meiothermus sp. TaxID=1955249 RepID=UPI0021DBEF2A|nr:ABC transporter ATP-binding protein [Meiothermus sp.]GIW25306.1 MAG: macrolide ABC transporter ATP-binding protein [Meiothermus sp.]
MTPVVQMQGVTKVYRSGSRARTVEVHALQGIDLTIYAGEYVALMGPSGSGKSTLMHIIGLLDSPTEGEYRLGGEPVRGLGEAQLARIRNQRVGFVFQAFFLLPRLTALHNVALPLVYRGVPLAERLKRAKAALEAVGLGDRLDHLPSELSGGQKQRVAIARALVQEPDLLLADEPTGNLDSKSSEEILELFDALHQQGKTLVVVTHEPDVGARAERIVRLRDGKIADGGMA